MGKHKFKLSDMIPNAWFYKLKDMNKPSKNTHSLTTYRPPPPPPPSSPPTSTAKMSSKPEPQCQSRKSYHITRELTIDHLKSPPRKSKSSSKSRKSTRRSSSISSSFSSQSTSTSLSSRSKSRSPPSPPSCEETDVVRKADNVGFLIEDALLKVKKEYMNEQSILDGNALPESETKHFENYQLPPIITKPQTQSKNHTHKIKEQRNSPPSRRLSVSSPGGMRLKINSPKLIARKQGQNGNKNAGKKSTSSKKRRSISESFAVVKSSFDPQRDFKESMEEMIVQNNLTAAKDLEDLLTCYLTLNLDEYHDVIIKVFKQIWCDFRHPT